MFMETCAPQKARARGFCDATLRRSPDEHIEARWGNDRGQAMAVGEVVVISATHPSVDALARSSIVSKQGGGLVLTDNGSTPCGDGTWRLDMEVNYVTYYRLCEAARAFATERRLGSCRSAIQLLVCTNVGRAVERRELNAAPGGADLALAVRDHPRFRGLNRSQQSALAAAFASRLHYIQGPLGTGKTAVASAMIATAQSLI